MEKFVLDSPALEEAVKLRSTANYPPRRPGRSSLKEVQATRGGGGGYNGYFTIKDVSTYNEDGTIKEYRVAVCDGETWDPEEEKSGDSTVRLNVNTKPVASTVLSPVARYIYLRYTASSNKIDIMSFDSTKDTDVGSGIYYYLLGEYIASEKRVIQRHTGNGNGEAQIWVVTFTCFS